MVVHYDYTVLAGTQGGRNHYKQDRMFELANRFRIPVVLFGEGGGGRPGDDSTGPGVAFDTHTFTQFSKLSGLVPLVSVINGRTFAGNTALVACCDVIIATERTTVAMGGPAMIEGGGLGIYTPEEVGPMSFQVPNGVVDILTKDEEEAVDVAKRYLSYFQGRTESWEAHDQRTLRHVVPENRLRLYDMKEIVHTIADVGSVLEIREKFGIGVITAFIRVEGHPMGVIANNPHHLAGAIDSDGADKGARFIQLCDAFDIPVLSLMDCPGMMVGPDVERTALVRHCVRMFNAGANLTTPLFGVVVRKAYGLGVQAMCGASALVGFFTVAWPTAEFAGNEHRGVRQARLPQGTRRHRGRGGAAPRVRAPRGARVRGCEGGQRGHRRRARRRDRPGGYPELDRQQPAPPAASGPADREEVPVHRYVVARPEGQPREGTSANIMHRGIMSWCIIMAWTSLTASTKCGGSMRCCSSPARSVSSGDVAASASRGSSSSGRGGTTGCTRSRTSPPPPCNGATLRRRSRVVSRVSGTWTIPTGGPSSTGSPGMRDRPAGPVRSSSTSCPTWSWPTRAC